MIKKPYAVDLGHLDGETLPLNGAFDPGDIDFSADDLRQLAALEWSASVEKTGGGARFSGELSTRIRLSCVRCVERVDETIHREFDLFFEQRESDLFKAHDEIELEESDTSTAFMVGTELFVDQVIREQVLLEVPMKPLCRPGCKGLCTFCGANLNNGPCGCEQVLVNPAFEPLLEFKKQLENQSGSAD
jgi:uncharacterized protein